MADAAAKRKSDAAEEAAATEKKEAEDACKRKQPKDYVSVLWKDEIQPTIKKMKKTITFKKKTYEREMDVIPLRALRTAHSKVLSAQMRNKPVGVDHKVVVMAIETARALEGSTALHKKVKIYEMALKKAYGQVGKQIDREMQLANRKTHDEAPFRRRAVCALYFVKICAELVPALATREAEERRAGNA